MGEKRFRPRLRRSWSRTAVLAVTTAVLVAPLAVFAADRFNDVPSSNIFHDDIGWLADAGITKGCNPPANTEYCPSDVVTREQMAAFMRRLAEGGVVDAATAETADFADRASEADDADTIDGLDSTELGSFATSVFEAQFNQVMANEGRQVMLSLTDIPPGGYVIFADARLQNGSGLQGLVRCWLVSGGTDLDQTGVSLNPFADNVQGEASVAMSGTLNVASSASVDFECDSGTLSALVFNTRITAMRVGTLIERGA